MEAADYELVEKCLKGDQDSFAVLVSRYKKLIYTVVYNMIKDKEEANDISQEVFIRVYKSMDRYNPQYKFSTWSVKIATNLCLDILRKRKVHLIPFDEIENISREVDTPERKYLSRERSHEIEVAIQKLPEKYRTPILLYHQKGASYKEMADIMGKPMSLIKNRLYRARLMLRESISIE